MRNVHFVVYSRVTSYLQGNLHCEEGRLLKEGGIRAEALELRSECCSMYKIISMP